MMINKFDVSFPYFAGRYPWKVAKIRGSSQQKGRTSPNAITQGLTKWEIASRSFCMTARQNAIMMAFLMQNFWCIYDAKQYEPEPEKKQ